jgi:sugar phosphate isomerase/epimerase
VTNPKNIFVSTTFAKDNSKISEVLNICKKENIYNVELGSNHIYEKNIKKIIQKYNFCFLVHNYFPIPKKNFVVNIASSNKKIRNASIQHAKNAIKFCKATNSELYTIHPGFLGDPIKASRNEKSYDFIWDKKNLNNNYHSAFINMVTSLKKIVHFAKREKIKVAIETGGSFKKKNLLLMQKPSEFREFFKFFKPNDLGVNLNIGHLNLASKAFKFSKLKFVQKLKKYILAIELSHNNGIEDQHLPLKRNMWYWKIINDPYFSRTYKILEFRNTSIQNIKNAFKFFNK